MQSKRRVPRRQRRMQAMGIDGGKAGWLAVAIEHNVDGSLGVFETVYEALITHPDADIVLAEMVLGTF